MVMPAATPPSPPSPVRWTRAMLEALPDDRQRHEIIDGYQRAGIAEYGIVDPDARLVERWRPGDERPEIVTDALRWMPRGDVARAV